MLTQFSTLIKGMRGNRNLSLFCRNAALCLVLIVGGCATSKPLPSSSTPKEDAAASHNTLAPEHATPTTPSHYGGNYPLFKILRDPKVNQEGFIDHANTTLPKSGTRLVNGWIKYFQTSGRPHFERWLSRSRAYMPVMKEILHREGLPEEIIYLAMIESGFNPNAYST